VAGRLGRGPAGPATRRYLLAGLLACGTYGRRLESAWSNGKPAYRCRHGYTSATGSSPDRPKNLYVREDQILPRLAALAILHADGGHSPQGGEQASAPVTASAQAADLIDRLQAADVTLIYDPATRALPARTGSPAWKTSPIWPPPKASSPRQRSRQRVNDLQALARRGQGQCRSRWRRAGPRAVPRCRAAAGVDHPVGGRQLRDIGDRTHPRAVPNHAP